MSQEHRKVSRIKHPFMLRYRPVGPGMSEWSLTPLRDLSGLGARFLSDRLLAKGDALEIRLMLSTSPQPVPLEGEVAWVKLDSTLGLPEVGVTFVVRDAATQELLDAAVRHFLERR